MRRKTDAAGRTRHMDHAVFERLTQRFERGPLELSELVQQQHAVMGQARLSRTQPRPAADDCCG